MNRLAKVLFAPIIATVVGGTPLMPTPAEAAKTPSPEAAALKEATAACKAEAKEDRLASQPQVREHLRRKDRQTHAGPTSGNFRKTGDRSVQGGGEGQEDRVACKSEIRWHLPLKRAQGLPS